MRTIPNHTPKLNDYIECGTGDAFVEALLNDFSQKLIVAERTNALVDTVAADHARPRFILNFDKWLGVSAGGSA